jgi:hypothetical protein
MISGIGFADTCRWVLDSRYPSKPIFSTLKANDGDRVFINGDYVVRFIEHLSKLRFHRKKYVYLIHNSDQPFDDVKLKGLLQSAIHIYAINTTVKHPQLTTIPLGFPDGAIPFVRTFVRPEVPRDIELYMNFSIDTNVQKRTDCWNTFKDDPRVVIRSNRTGDEYYEDLCRSKFVLCPEGTGMDTHRIYEAIFCGAIPVVLRNPLSEFYRDYPIKIIEQWTKLNG